MVAGGEAETSKWESNAAANENLPLLHLVRIILSIFKRAWMDEWQRAKDGCYIKGCIRERQNRMNGWKWMHVTRNHLSLHPATCAHWDNSFVLYAFHSHSRQKTTLDIYSMLTCTLFTVEQHGFSQDHQGCWCTGH